MCKIQAWTLHASRSPRRLITKPLSVPAPQSFNNKYRSDHHYLTVVIQYSHDFTWSFREGLAKTREMAADWESSLAANAKAAEKTIANWKAGTTAESNVYGVPSVAAKSIVSWDSTATESNVYMEHSLAAESSVYVGATRSPP